MSGSADALAARWHELVKVGLVGTARQAPALPGPLPAFARAGDPEGALLAEAGALALYRRAGRVPPRTTAPPPAPAPLEARPRCRPGAARVLAGLLEGGEAELAGEWLALAARAGVRADEAQLPELLDLGRAHRELRPAVLAAVGERGRWLAPERVEWRWAAGPPPEADWGTAARADRLALLRELRVADPARGRALVESTFAEDGADERAAFVAALADGLCDADEPFLESALDDRRKEVRRAAARLLWRLPRSRLAARMAVRSRRFVDLGRRAPVAPPQAFAPEWARDGIEPSPPRGRGARAFWLQQIVAATPLAIWGAPGAALAALRGDDWAEVLLGAWAVAAARQREPAWAEALLRATCDLPDLFAVLPPARREALVVELGRYQDLGHMHHAWSERFSRAVRAHLRRAGTVGEARLAERFVHPAVAAEMLAERPSPVLEARVAMHKELAR